MEYSWTEQDREAKAREAFNEVLIAEIEDAVEAAAPRGDPRKQFYGEVLTYVTAEILGAQASTRANAPEELDARTVFEEAILERIHAQCDPSNTGELCKDYILRALHMWLARKFVESLSPLPSL